PLQIVEKYMQWAANYRENQITIIYDTMWGGTRRMAEEIAAGIHAADPEVVVKVFNSARTDKNDIITEIFKSKAIIAGSPTVNRGILSSLAGLIEEVKGLAFKDKKAAVFGTYGWSGESPKVLSKLLTGAGFAVMEDEFKNLWHADEEACREFGRRFWEYSR
ncbi:MAG: beta-lactamase domain protein, partial [Firmicutes bacterium]|nr:beta-lactamase domain protein [Bacillota bacterium]